MGSVGTEFVIRIFAIIKVYPLFGNQIKVAYLRDCYLLPLVIIATSVKFAQLRLGFHPIEITIGVSGNGEVVSVL